MICDTCKTAAALSAPDEPNSSPMPLAEALALHADCKGGTHCDCQHKPTLLQDNGSRSQRRD